MAAAVRVVYFAKVQINANSRHRDMRQLAQPSGTKALAGEVPWSSPASRLGSSPGHDSQCPATAIRGRSGCRVVRR